MSDDYTNIEKTAVGQKAAGPVGWLDDRLGLAGAGRKLMPVRKVFPEHWSFMLGEIALWSFIVLLLTGVFLTFWFDPSMAETVYDGSYAPLRGLEMSKAYASTLEISFDIRGGLLMRQVHHWAAAIFVAAMIVHMLRIFFTGAYRKPREVNWLVGVGLLSIGLVEGFAGYSLPDDLLSGTGLRFVDGLIRSIPLVGSYLEFFIFGGEFPGDIIIPRLYMAHILLIPAILLGLIGLHMVLLVYQKHTQWPGPGHTENNVVGYPLLPQYAAKAGGFFMVVFGFTALMGATLQINPIWLYGPYNPSEVTAGSQPDWYMGFVEGAVRVMPAWEFDFLSFTWSMNVFIPAVLLMGVLFTLLGAWPFVEQWITGDKREHHLLERPRNAPVRTIPVSTGDTKHRTRQGTKVIMEKFPKVDMDAATTGVDSEDPDYYDISDVKWAMRVTNSGEFLHAAPWSAASHGRANVSHGCTGMSTANADWLYHQSNRGDVVKFKNSPRGMEDQNGWTDWNVSWDDWKAGSALA